METRHHNNKRVVLYIMSVLEFDDEKIRIIIVNIGINDITILSMMSEKEIRDRKNEVLALRKVMMLIHFRN